MCVRTNCVLTQTHKHTLTHFLYCRTSTDEMQTATDGINDSMIENKQRQNRKSLLWKQICAFHAKQRARDMKIALKMCLLRRWISHTFVAAGCILIIVCKSVLIHAAVVRRWRWWLQPPPNTEIWWRWRFFPPLFDCLSDLIAVDFINVSMARKCNNKNIFSSANSFLEWWGCREGFVGARMQESWEF